MLPNPPPLTFWEGRFTSNRSAPTGEEPFPTHRFLFIRKNGSGALPPFKITRTDPCPDVSIRMVEWEEEFQIRFKLQLHPQPCPFILQAMGPAGKEPHPIPGPVPSPFPEFPFEHRELFVEVYSPVPYHSHRARRESESSLPIPGGFSKENLLYYVVHPSFPFFHFPVFRPFQPPPLSILGRFQCLHRARPGRA